MGTFEPGHPKRGGRKKGTPNKVGLPWKQFTAALCEDPEHQEKLLAASLERPELVFKAAEHAFGKPKETKEVTGEFRMIQWPGDKDISES